ncbi:hypothetical protein [Burkholderia pseudomallei]|nr:hypothetical protein [Burkholderia pseudomallei]
MPQKISIGASLFVGGFLVWMRAVGGGTSIAPGASPRKFHALHSKI